MLGRSPSTISREIVRNGGAEGYRATRSDQAACLLVRVGPEGLDEALEGWIARARVFVTTLAAK